MWTIFKDFIEFVINKNIASFFIFWFLGHKMWGLSSLIRDGTRLPCIESRSL